MTAADARCKAEKHHTMKAQNQYDDIKKRINIEVNYGAFELSYTGIISDTVKKMLASEGFIIHKSSFDRNETLTKITW